MKERRWSRSGPDELSPLRGLRTRVLYAVFAIAIVAVLALALILPFIGSK